MNLRSHLRIAASGMALIMAEGVHAQNQSDAENVVAIDDIVVTAQKREQSLQDVPVSIAAFTAESIEALGAETMGDLDTFTPGLSVDDSSVTQPRYTIRGVSTDDFGVGTEPAVGVFIDGIYAARSGNALIFFDDLERVEVLKGPQGTLFGRNTSAGAVSVITRKPSQSFEAAGRLTLGNDEKRRASGMVNIPLGDMVALRVNGVYNRRDGYLTDAVTGEDYERENNWSGRAAIAFRPSAATEIIISYDHDTTDKDGPAAIGVGPFALSRDPFGPFANDVIGGSHETRKLDAFTLSAEHEFGDVTLTSLTSFRKFRTTNREDEDGTNLPERYLDTENIERNRNFYQELRLSQNGDRLKWVLGGSFFKEKARQSSVVTNLTDSVNTALDLAAGFPVFSILNEAGLPVFGLPWQESMNNVARNRSFAIFGDATYAVTPELNLTFGARYTWDRKRFSWFNEGYSASGLDAVVAPGALYNAILGQPAFPEDAMIDVNTFYRAAGGKDLIFDVGPLEGVPFETTRNFEDFSPRFVVDYKVAPHVMIYASAARGYKAGGFNSVQINSFFRPEKVWSYEAGVKSDLFGRLRLNASTYYFNYKDRQSISLEHVSESGIPQYVTTSGDSEAWGVDFEAQFAATPQLRLSLVGGYIDSKWNKRFERGPFSEEAGPMDLSGQPTGEPSLRVVLGANYDRELANGSSIFADASYSYTSRGRTNAAIRANDAVLAKWVDFSKFGKLRASREIVNARVGWRARNDDVSIALFAENLFNVKTVRGINSISAETFGTPYTRLDRPRSWGIELSAKF